MTVEVKTLFVSSENRDTTLYPDGNSYVLHINTPIKEIRRVELLHASVPNTLYNVTNGSNVFGIQATADNQGDAYIYFSIPEGFYSGSGLATEITNAVNNLTNVTVNYLSNEGKFLFSRPTASSGTFSLIINTTEMQDVLGLSSETNSSNVAAETSGEITLYSNNTRYDGKEFIKSSTIVNLHPNEGIFLDILELRTPYTEDAKDLDNSGQSMRRSFGLIPMDANGGNIKRFKKTTDYDLVIDYTYPIQKLDRLTVNWVDRNGQIVNFNGANDNSFMLRFHTLRRNL